MRTLFLNEKRSKLHMLRVALWCALISLVSLGVLAMLDGSLNWPASALGALAIAVMAGLAAFAGRWFHLRRMKNTSRDLKDSALW
ncbi:MAG: hypothetical protein CVU22_01800 [Betaproteobacteria bacterium HGW-Betaproteobacteria-16]|nr:MAG: hypothetical protein CVU22_01800 [Betaproteobacteria bacterium HGW-Betaproteobacteria-16]